MVVTLGGTFTYRSSTAVMGGKYMIGVSSAHRKAAGLATGDLVEIQLELDTAPREVAVPTDLASALAEDGRAQAFQRVAYSNKRRHVESIKQTKTPETRARRIAKVVETLRTDG